ncbi:MAG: hypothetical protein BBJ57_05810 [Desulfobacterales bacterium PC51MH44]|nr:MAG: hypothetical protein BBJ57_05810 [Desulfobacterales bacterium PC51MH44]
MRTEPDQTVKILKYQKPSCYQSMGAFFVRVSAFGNFIWQKYISKSLTNHRRAGYEVIKLVEKKAG